MKLVVREPAPFKRVQELHQGVKQALTQLTMLGADSSTLNYFSNLVNKLQKEYQDHAYIVSEENGEDQSTTKFEKFWKFLPGFITKLNKLS